MSFSQKTFKRVWTKPLRKTIVNYWLGPHDLNTYLQEWYIMHLAIFDYKIAFVGSFMMGKTKQYPNFLQQVWDQNLFKSSLETKFTLMVVPVIYRGSPTSTVSTSTISTSTHFVAIGIKLVLVGD